MMDNIKLDKKSLSKFGITMGMACLVIAGIILLRHKDPFALLSVSALFFLAAMALPGILKPFYVFWMKMAFVLAWVNTRLILMVIYFLIFAPVGIFMRIFRIDPLDRKIEKDRDSYWLKNEKEEFNPLNYERRF